ncbi:MAG: GNAT family N-acetyltransferase [Planctomycetota bacterium]
MAEPAPAWRCLPLAALTPHELYRVLDLRTRVFVVEQTCPYRDTDGLDLDPGALHLLGERGQALVAYARLLPPGLAYPEPAIGRVVTAPEARRGGLGKALMLRAIEEVEARWPGPIQIGAQRYLERFYGELGFAPVGEPYLEDGIPHVHMIRP